jgi:hypothetical protein
MRRAAPRLLGTELVREISSRATGVHRGYVNLLRMLLLCGAVRQGRAVLRMLPRISPPTSSHGTALSELPCSQGFKRSSGCGGVEHVGARHDTQHMAEWSASQCVPACAIFLTSIARFTLFGDAGEPQFQRIEEVTKKKFSSFSYSLSL